MKKSYELTDLSPREAMDLYPGPGLPIRGGWGYEGEDACIIDKDDPIVDKNSPIPFYGTDYEKNLCRTKNLSRTCYLTQSGRQVFRYRMEHGTAETGSP